MDARTWTGLGLSAACAATLTFGCSSSPATESDGESSTLMIRDDIPARLKKLSPTPISYDLSKLSATERAVLDRLIRASRLMDEIYRRQVSAGNPELRERLLASKDPRAKDAARYFDIAFGPWDPLENDEPFIGITPRPPGAGFYPEDLTEAQLNDWIATHPDDEKALTSLTTVVRRDGGHLVAVPYSKEYREWLEPAAKLLRESAAITDDPSLERFLRLRAEAFLSDDYFASDVAWMDLDSRIELTIGPYEVYTDKLFNYKAAFESFVTIQDPDESARLKSWASQLPEMERRLPIPDEFKNVNRGADSPIRVVYEIFRAGDARAGIPAIAFNLPNDERVREEKGSKKVLLKNMMEAKFNKVLLPIADRVLATDQRPYVTFDAFFAETLLHELSHGLGPGKIRLASGKETEVRLELKDHYSALEEAKADVMGVTNAEFLMEQSIVSRDLERMLFPTYLAGMFRSARFGVDEAHGQGAVLQFNWVFEAGGFQLDPETRRFRVDAPKAMEALRSLLSEILLVQAKGDYAGAQSLLERHGKPRPEMLALLDPRVLGDVPVDVEPIYVVGSGRRD